MNVHLGHTPSFSRFECVSDIGWVGRSVGRIKKKTKIKIIKKSHKKSWNWRPGTPASLRWSLETTTHEPKIIRAEKVVDVIVKLRQHCKKNQLLKLLCHIPASLTFQQLLQCSFFRLKELFKVKNTV